MSADALLTEADTEEALSEAARHDLRVLLKQMARARLRFANNIGSGKYFQLHLFNTCVPRKG